MTDEIKTELLVDLPLEYKTTKLAKSAFIVTDNKFSTNTWNPADIDKLEIRGLKEFNKVIEDCRFFYRRDPIASTVINKTVEIGIPGLSFENRGLSENEFRIFEGIRPQIESYMEICALEYLISGLVVPEMTYSSVTKDTLVELGVKKYTSLTLPTSLWLRDPTTIEIKDIMIADKPSYFVVLPESFVYFILNKGKYQDGSEDSSLYNYILVHYPELVSAVLAGNKKILLENDLITRRKVITGSEYPTPYLYPALESLKHKRNLRRMDYSIASRVISAIMLIQEGSDEFPVTEDEPDAFNHLKNQMAWRNSGGRDVEKIFQLFSNHTTKITWIMPDISALINDKKYAEINADIFYSLGFPKILTTGETERTQTSNPEFAVISPQRTMENMQSNLLPIARRIVYDIYKLNGLKTTPLVKFKSINLHALEEFFKAATALYDTGNLSRESYDKILGYDFETEINKKKNENDLLEDLGVEEFAPQAFSPQPKNNQKPEEDTQKPEEDTNKPED